MTLPEKFNVLIITLSDRVHKGEYEDLSGPKVKEHVIDFFKGTAWKYEIDLLKIPDDAGELESLLVKAKISYNLIFTTGGTGIGSRDITPDVVVPMFDKEIPGIMDMIRVKYGSEKPNALLTRSAAGVIENSIVYVLPGSVRAVDEYMTEIKKSLEHLIYMQYDLDIHDKLKN